MNKLSNLIKKKNQEIIKRINQLIIYDIEMKLEPLRSQEYFGDVRKDYEENHKKKIRVSEKRYQEESQIISDFMAKLLLNFSKATEDNYVEGLLDIYYNIMEKICENYYAEITMEVNNTLGMQDGNIEKSFSHTSKNRLKNINIQYIEQLDAMKELQPFSVNDKQTLIIGANGTGKTLFIKKLKHFFSDHDDVVEQEYFNNPVVVIEAEKKLKFTMDEYVEVRQHIREESRDSLELIISNICENFLKENARKNPLTYEDDVYMPRIFKLFSKIFPNINWSFNNNLRIIEPQKNNQIFNVCDMSSGERAALYFICRIIIAPEESYVIIDEPEIHLNPAISNTIWEEIRKIKPQAKFIYITHDIDYIRYVQNQSEIMWFKSYTHPGEWKMERLGESKLPIECVQQIIGSAKPILFCEGEKSSSIDEQIYNALLNDYFTIYPSGGAATVKENTKVYNETLSRMTGLRAFGIVDHDFMSQDRIMSLEENNVHCLPVHEAEMLLLDEELMKEIVEECCDSTEKENLISIFKTDLCDLMNKNKEEIKAKMIKELLDAKISTFNLTKGKTTDAVLGSISEIREEISQENIMEFINSVIFPEEFTEDNYEEILKYCTLKGQVIPGMTDKRFKSIKYSKYSLIHLNRTKVKDHLRKKYFNGLLKALEDNKTH